MSDSDKSLKYWIATAITLLLGLATNYFLDKFSEPRHYFIFFSIFVLVLGIVVWYGQQEAKNKVLKMTGELSENIKRIEAFNKIASEQQQALSSNLNELVALKSHVTNIVETSQYGKSLFLPIELAVKMEDNAINQVFIISRDPELELKDEFYKVVCENLLQKNPITYTYFFPKSGDPHIKFELKDMINKLKTYGDGKQITDNLLNDYLKIYRVEYILNTIVIVDPYLKASRAGWIFPNSKFERHIVEADEYLLNSAILQNGKKKRTRLLL